jgi:hypothetical protein
MGPYFNFGVHDILTYHYHCSFADNLPMKHMEALIIGFAKQSAVRN